MDAALRYAQVLRVVIETTSPMLVGTGRGDALRDALFVTDANGLPAIPGTTIAGLLRHAWRAAHTDVPVEDLFGFAGAGNDEGAASRLHIGWAVMHDANDRPVPPLADRNRLLEDTLCRPLLTQPPPTRDHVRLNARGTVDGAGKFDRCYVPAGHRFTVEIRYHTNEADDPVPARLLALLAGGSIRFGQATRSGYGAFRVLRARVARFDFRDAQAIADYARLPAPLDDNTGFRDCPVVADASGTSHWLHVELSVTSEQGFRIGGGKTARVNAGKPADLLPFTARRVHWQRQGGGEQAAGSKLEVIVTGSGLRGALAHRVAFHHNRLTGRWADDGADTAAVNEAVVALFGDARDDADDGPAGQPGIVWFEDMTVDDSAMQRWHNGIDRFTGGVRDGVLFSEETVVARQPLKLALRIDTRRPLSPVIRRAFGEALADLCEGRLALGAAGARGHGYFRGDKPLLANRALMAWLEEPA